MTRNFQKKNPSFILIMKIKISIIYQLLLFIIRHTDQGTLLDIDILYTGFLSLLLLQCHLPSSRQNHTVEILIPIPHKLQDAEIVLYS